MACAQEKGKGCFQPLWQQYIKKEAAWAPRIIKRQQLSTLQVSVWFSWTGTGKWPSLFAAKKSEKDFEKFQSSIKKVKKKSKNLKVSEKAKKSPKQ